MKLTEIKCPCCDGNVQINFNKQEAKCNYCDTVFIISNVFNDQEKKEVETKSIKEKPEIVKRASKYVDYYEDLYFEISKLFSSLANSIFERTGYFDTSIDIPRSNKSYLCDYVSGFAIPIVYYKDVEVNKEKLAPNYYRNQYEEWLKENKDLYTKLVELETKLREVEKKPISLSKKNNQKITSDKEDVAFLKEYNSNDYDEKKVTELEKNLGVRIDDLKFTKVELLLFSKKKDVSKEIKKEFNNLKQEHMKGKELKKRCQAYDTLSAEEIEFLNTWLTLRDLVKKYGENLVRYTKNVDFFADKDRTLTEENKQDLKELEVIMDEIKLELDKTNLLNVVKEEAEELQETKNVKKIG